MLAFIIGIVVGALAFAAFGGNILAAAVAGGLALLLIGQVVPD